MSKESTSLKPTLLILDSDEMRRNEIYRLAIAAHSVKLFTGQSWFEGKTRLASPPENADAVLFHQSNLAFKSLVKSTVWDSRPVVVWYSGGGVSNASLLNPPGYGIIEPVKVNAKQNTVADDQDAWSALLAWLANANRENLPTPALFAPRVVFAYLSSLIEFLRIYLAALDGEGEASSAQRKVLESIGYDSSKHSVSPPVRTWISNIKNWKSVFGEKVAGRLESELNEKWTVFPSIRELARKIDAGEFLDPETASSAYDCLMRIRVPKSE